MKYYPYGTTPSETPEWFVKALSGTMMDATEIPLWHLDDSIQDGEMQAADSRKNEVPPSYVPLPGDAEVTVGS